MPYEIKRKGEKWLTVNSETGEVKGTHDSKQKAVAQLRLLYGVEGGMKVRKK